MRAFVLTTTMNIKRNKFSAVDVSAHTTMKDAAKCDNHCELQNLANQQVSECIVHTASVRKQCTHFSAS